MTEYTVIWAIALDADSPTDAALQAKVLTNDMDFGPESANVFHAVPGAFDPSAALPEATVVDLGKADITADGDISNLDELAEPATAPPTTATAGGDTTHRVLVTETLTYEIDLDVAEMKAAGVDPEDTSSMEFDSYIADVTSSLHTGRYPFSVQDCQRETTWLI